MGNFSVDSLPEQFSIVWCLFPQVGEKNRASAVARPTLVLDVRVEQEQEIGALLVAYGTGTDEDKSPYLDGGPDLVIDTLNAARALGLHKPTRFSMSPRRRRLLLWSDEYFIAAPYKAGGSIVAGVLSPFQIARVKACFRERGLESFWTV